MQICSRYVTYWLGKVAGPMGRPAELGWMGQAGWAKAGWMGQAGWAEAGWAKAGWAKQAGWVKPVGRNVAGRMG